MEEILDFSRSRLAWTERMAVGDFSLTPDQIIDALAEHMTPERRARLSSVVSQRSLQVVSVLENIYDRGNVSAVMRSSEAFGFLGMNLVDAPGARFKAANRVTRGADKWLDVRTFHRPEEVAGRLRGEGYQIWATHLDSKHSIDTLDWSKPMAIVLGNEKDGVSSDMMKLVDGAFHVPMQGFSQSFNISVAAALIYYRARLELQRHGDSAGLTREQQQRVLANYYLRSFDNPEMLLKAKGFRAESS